MDLKKKKEESKKLKKKDLDKVSLTVINKLINILESFICVLKFFYLKFQNKIVLDTLVF